MNFDNDDRGLRLLHARETWVGVVLDYGAFSRIVRSVEIDNWGRLVLMARSHDECGLTPELATKWVCDGLPRKRRTQPR